MDEFLYLIDGTTYKKKAPYPGISVIEPIEFVCSCAFSSGNDFTLKIPYRKDLAINLGDWVRYKDTEFGGMIMGYEIDRKNKTVTYKGLSGFGVLSNIIATWEGACEVKASGVDYLNNTAETAVYIHGDSTHDGHKDYNFALSCDYWVRYFNLPYTFTLTELPGGGDLGSYEWYSSTDAETFKDEDDNWVTPRYRLLKLAGGTTLFNAITSYCKLVDQKFTAKWSNGNLDVRFSPISTYRYIIDDENVIYADSLKASHNFINITDRASPYANKFVHFIYNSGGIGYDHIEDVTAAVIWGGTGSYGGKYNNSSQVHANYYEITNSQYSDTVDESENALTEARNSQPLVSSVTLDSSKISADVGDYLYFTDPEFNITTEKMRISEKLLTISNNTATIKYSIGG